MQTDIEPIIYVSYINESGNKKIDEKGEKNERIISFR